MQIYLLYKRYYDNYDDLVMCDCYPYQNYEDAVQRIVDETERSTGEVEKFLSTGDSTVPSGDWDYEIEETELL